jgi:hypothetical protein
LSPSSSLTISINDLAIPSQGMISGRDLMGYILSIYFCSVCRLDLLFLVSNGKEDEALHMDMTSELFFPFNESDIRDLQTIIQRVKRKCAATEEVLRSMILSWSESKESILRKQATQLKKEFKITERASINTMKDDPKQKSPYKERKPLAEPDHRMKASIQNDSVADMNKQTYHSNILISGKSIDDNLLERAKAEIIAKYAKLTNEVELRRSTLQWRKNRAQRMNLARLQLKELFQSEVALWRKQLQSKDTLSSQAKDTDPSAMSGNTSKRVDGRVNGISNERYLLPGIKSIYSGVRISQQPGGDSSFALSYDLSDSRDTTIQPKNAASHLGIDYKYLYYFH